MIIIYLLYYTSFIYRIFMITINDDIHDTRF